MSASSDRDRHARALEKARKVRLPDDYPKARAGHYWVDRARAETWTAKHGDAFTSLAKARHVAPQQTRYHPGVHETVSTLLRARAKAPGELLEFAGWCGVQPGAICPGCRTTTSRSATTTGRRAASGGRRERG